MNAGHKFDPAILETLKKVKYPGYSRDIVSFGMVKDISADDHSLTVQLAMNGVNEAVAQKIKEDTERMLKEESNFEQIHVNLKNIPHDTSRAAKETKEIDHLSEPKRIPGVEKIIAVSSGKGGVGKSTIAVNLACTAAKLGKRVGLMDADIHGPSLPTLLGITSKPSATEKGITPIERHGIKSMSIGFLVESGQPMIWRGPMLNKALEQILSGTIWGELDCLFVDLPPGTGDVQISLAQKYRINGAIVVTTPQNLALEDVHRGAVMFKHTKVPVLGIVENMSYYRCGNCGHLSHPFGEGGGKRVADILGIPLLGALPMEPKILEYGDMGEPIVLALPDSETAEKYRELWINVVKWEEVLVSK